VTKEIEKAKKKAGNAGQTVNDETILPALRAQFAQRISYIKRKPGQSDAEHQEMQMLQAAKPNLSKMIEKKRKGQVADDIETAMKDGDDVETHLQASQRHNELAIQAAERQRESHKRARTTVQELIDEPDEERAQVAVLKEALMAAEKAKREAEKAQRAAELKAKKDALEEGMKRAILQETMLKGAWEQAQKEALLKAKALKKAEEEALETAEKEAEMKEAFEKAKAEINALKALLSSNM